MTAEILRGIRVNLDNTASFYTTLNGEKQRHTIPSEFIFASHRDDLENVQTLRKEVFESIGLEGEIADSGYKKKTLHIRGNSIAEKKLKTHWRKFFKESLNVSGPEEYVIRYPIYSLIEFDRSGKPQVVGVADLKDIPGRVGALDIEKKAGKGSRYGVIVMNTIGDRVKKQLFVLEENAPDSLGELQNVEIVPVQTEQEIVEGTREVTRRFDTIVIHNAPFDIGELRNIKEKRTQKVLIGEDGFETHIRGHDFIRRVWHPEIDFVDTCKVSQYATPNIRDTLDYAAAYFKSSKRKLLGSGDLEFLINNPTPENNRKVAAYNVVDIDIVLDCGEKAIDYLAPVARFFGRSIGNIGAVSKYTSAQQVRDREYWRNLNVFRAQRALRVPSFDRKGQQKGKDFSYAEARRKLLSKALGINFETGLHKNVLVFYPTIMKPAGTEGVESLEESLLSGDARARNMRAEFVDALCREQLYDLQRSEKASQSQKSIFWASYGVDVDKMAAELNDDLEEIAAMVKANNFTPINLGNRYVYLKINPQKSLESFSALDGLDYKHGVVFGTADSVLSMGPGHIVWRVDNELYAEGADPIGRYGLRNEFERTTCKALILTAFDEGITAARDDYEIRIEALAEHDVAHKDLAFKIRHISRYPSIQAAESLRRQIIRELDLKEKEEAYAIYGTDKRWHRLEEGVEPNYESYLETAIGKNYQDGKTASVSRFDYALSDIKENFYESMWNKIDKA